MSRKNIGVSEELHTSLKDFSKDIGLPLTVILEYWLSTCSEADWDSVKKRYDETKPTWSNMRKVIQEYQRDYPDADDKKLSELTGFSIAQVETLTHTAHKRVIAYCMQYRTRGQSRVAKDCNVSERFAGRIMKVLSGEQKPTKYEKGLFNTGSC